jgi:histidinol-phosphate phosphatase family protein
MRQAVILAGGRGTRLQERLAGRPKPMVDVDGQPLLGRQLRELGANGFTDIVILVSHAAAQIEAFCTKAEFRDLAISLIHDDVPQGTAGALLSAYDRLARQFLVVYGDTLFGIDVERFWRVHQETEADVSLFLHPNDHPFDSDLVEIDGTGRVLGFHHPPHGVLGSFPNLVNAAMYIVRRESIAFWGTAATPSDIARNLFPEMILRGARLQGYVSFEYIKDIGTPERLDKATRHLREGVVDRARRDRPQKAVFFDRDGTINELAGYITRPEDVALTDGVGEALRLLNDAEYRIAVVTNQPALARGDVSNEGMRRIHNRMQWLIGRVGAFVDGIFICPHHPDGGFDGEIPQLKILCDCRKPGTALIERAAVELNVDIENSWLIGDSTSDILAATRSGLRSILVKTGEGGGDRKYAARPDFVKRNAAAAVRFILYEYMPLLAAMTPILDSVSGGDVIIFDGVSRRHRSILASAIHHLLVEGHLEAHVMPLDSFARDNDESRPEPNGTLSLLDRLTPWLCSDRAICVATEPCNWSRQRPASWTEVMSLGSESILIWDEDAAFLRDIGLARRCVQIVNVASAISAVRVAPRVLAAPVGGDVFLDLAIVLECWS